VWDASGASPAHVRGSRRQERGGRRDTSRGKSKDNFLETCQKSLGRGTEKRRASKEDGHLGGGSLGRGHDAGEGNAVGCKEKEKGSRKNPKEVKNGRREKGKSNTKEKEQREREQKNEPIRIHRGPTSITYRYKKKLQTEKHRRHRKRESGSKPGPKTGGTGSESDTRGGSRKKRVTHCSLLRPREKMAREGLADPAGRSTPGLRLSRLETIQEGAEELQRLGGKQERNGEKAVSSPPVRARIKKKGRDAFVPDEKR